MAKTQKQALKPENGPVVPRGIMTAPFINRVSLPVATAGPYSTHSLDITFTNDPDVADKFVDAIYKASTFVIGFDLEHRPTYRPGQKANISLLQFATFSPDHQNTYSVLLYSIYHDSGKIPERLQQLLRDPSLQKFGVGIHGDLRHLRYLNLAQDAKESFKELGPMALRAGVVDRKTIGLKALIAATMGEECTAYKTKSLTMTNWELANLNAAQLRYAAMDAAAGLKVWDILSALREVPRPPEDIGHYQVSSADSS